MPEYSDKPRDRWHVGREIPLALLIGLLMQAGVAVWWGGKIDTRVSNVEVGYVEMKVRLDKKDEESIRLVRVEEQLRSAVRELESLNRNLTAIVTAMQQHLVDTAVGKPPPR